MTAKLLAMTEIAPAGGRARLTALELEREWERLLREREVARAQALALAEANRRMEEFLGIATHELKTPVTSSRLGVALAARRMQGLLGQVAACVNASDAELAGLPPSRDC